MEQFYALFNVISRGSSITASKMPHYVFGRRFGMEWRLWQGVNEARLIINDEKAKGFDWPEYSTVDAIEMWVAEHQPSILSV